MNILWIIKRWTMGQDVICQKFGRYYHLPVELARRGHRISVLALDYKSTGSECFTHSGVTWYSTGGIIQGLVRYLQRAASLVRDKRPDWVIGATDMHFCIMAYYLGKIFRIPIAHDIYDDFETFASGRILRLTPLFYHVLDTSSHVISFHHKLSEYLHQKAPHACHNVIPNCVDPDQFRPLDSAQCRKELDLPPDIPIIGYFGAIDLGRGMDTLWSAFEQVKKSIPDILMVLAGRTGKGFCVERPGVLYRGFLPHNKMPLYINACNVVVITCYKKIAYLKYSMPMKSIEYMACGAPFVAPNIGGLPEEAGVGQNILYEPDNSDDLARKILFQLEQPRPRYPSPVSWSDAGSRLESILIQEPNRDNSARF